MRCNLSLIEHRALDCPVGANNTKQHLALLDREVGVIERLERGALFNRLAGEPPPLVKRSGLQALYLAELVFLGDVVDFDDGHGV